ncbi:MAG: hypothetical protein Q4F10_02765 [Corynebacterium glutamicum]|nr:hypothetical protein [Corynebacterium glutamicum]
MKKKAEEYMRVHLEGARFENAHVPVSVFEELLRYKKLVLKAAAANWAEDNPDREVPDDLLEGFDLTLTAIEPGSATNVLERDVVSEFEDSYAAGQNDVDQLLEELFKQDLAVASFPDWADDEALWQLGSSLSPGDNLSIIPEESASRKVYFTREQRDQVLPSFREALKEYKKPLRTNEEGFVVGRIRQVDSGAKSFKLISGKNTVHGRYASSYAAETIGTVIGKETNGEETFVRVTGSIRLANGAPTLIRSTDDVEIITSEAVPRRSRILEIAKLTRGWVDGFYGEPVEVEVLKAALNLSAKIYEEQPAKEPEIFPTEDGEIEFQWIINSVFISLCPQVDGKFIFEQVSKGDSREYKFESWEEVKGELNKAGVY